MTISFILVLVLVFLIPGSMMIKELRLNKKIKSIKVGQRYEEITDHENPFKKGQKVKMVISIKDGYILYKDKDEFTYSRTLRSFAKNFVLVRDIENIDYIIG